MARSTFVPALFAALALPGCPAPDPTFPVVEDPVAYADPFVGSGGYGFNSASIHPAAMAPGGLAKVGPDTTGPNGTVRFLHYSGYWHGDDTVQAFTHLHIIGTGAPDLGSLAVMPIGEFHPERRESALYESRFDKATERATPGFYEVTLERTGTRVEIAAAPHAAIHRWTWPAATGTARLLLDLTKHLDAGEVRGMALSFDPSGQRLTGRLVAHGSMSGGHGGVPIFFDLRTNRPWTRALAWSPEGGPDARPEVSGDEDVGAVLEFDLADGAPLTWKIGLSIVDLEGATRNLEAEIPAWDLDAVKAATEALWRHELSAIRLSGGTEDERRNFYSSLYHAQMMPTVYSDVDGRYRGNDGAFRTVDGWRYVSDLSLWDTYRTANPLYSLVYPELARDVARSLVEMAKIGGFPRWPLGDGETGVMLGAPADIVLADSAVKGVPGVDWSEAWTLLRGAALEPDWELRGARSDGWGEYAANHFFSGHTGRYVSKTIELAHADFGLSQLAASLGHAADADTLRTRSRGWRKHYDPAYGFLMPLERDGTFSAVDEGFVPHAWWRYYAEGSAWQTLWGAPHDVEGYVALMGSADVAVARLEEFFQGAYDEWNGWFDRNDAAGAWVWPSGWYFHPNEPSIHIAYMFAQLGRPDLTQKWLAWIVPTFYRPAPDGRPGNDDGGAMASWWLFTAMGLYPVPGSEYYVVGAPWYPKVEIRRGDGYFTVLAPAASPENRYVQSVTLDGVELEAAVLRHAELKAGSVLRFVMGPKPGTWGVRN